MSLSEPGAKREPLHRRTIEIVGYKREDGLYDIEGRLLDRKDVAFPVGGRRLAPGEAVHDMWLRITVDREMRIVDAAASSDAMPYIGQCDRIAPDYRKLIGLAIGITGVAITSFRVRGHTDSFGLVSNSQSFLPVNAS